MRFRIPAVLQDLWRGRATSLPPIPADSSFTGGLSGARLAHFQLADELGRGGMGVVYRARDTRLDRPVAIKAIRAGAAADPTAQRRFGFEARAAARLRHPYICQVFDLLQAGDEELIVMELLEGESLQARLARGALPVAEAVRLAAEAAEALREAHAHGIVHRDIKPSNLFVTDSGHVKVMDFGVARLLDAVAAPEERTAAPGDRTGSSGVVGTVGYFPPEQASGGAVDERGDVFALGVVLFEMLCGVHPFAAPGLVAYLGRLFTEPAPPVLRWRPEAGEALDALVRRMLAASPEERPRSMAEVHQRLISLNAPAAAVPSTRYARNGEVSIAYQVFGSGPVDLVYVPGWVSHLEAGWQEPRVAAFFRRLAAFSRVIMLDKRGTGLSDRATGYPTLEDRMDDLRAVMDAVGSERAVLFGMSEGGNMVALFAATHPERTIALVTFGVFAKRVYSEDYPWAPTPEVRGEWLRTLEAEWGGPVDLETLAPSLAGDAAFAAWWATYLRLGASPGAALELARSNTEIEVRDVLKSVEVPTLVLHRTGDRDVRVEEGRYIASIVRGATYREFAGDDHLIYAGDTAEVVDEIARFVRELRPSPPPSRRWRVVVSAGAPGPRARAAGTALVERLCAELPPLERGSSETHLHVTFDGPVRAQRFAHALVTAARRLGVPLGAGVAAGPCDAAAASPAGGPVEEADALASRAAPYEVLVTDAVRALGGPRPAASR